MKDASSTKERMLKAAFLTGVLALGTLGPVALWLSWLDRCEERCAGALARAEVLAEQGQFLSALRLLDDADASCDCMRFTEGDEPAEHAAARTWLRAIEGRDGPAALNALKPRGPMLRRLMAPADAASSTSSTAPGT